MHSVLVTGSAGFIGFHLSRQLLDEGFRVIGLDAMTDYYDIELKKARLKQLTSSKNYRAVEERIETPGTLADLFEYEKPNIVIHLAAQAGVRYSIENPRSYLESNINGTFELIEAARAFPPKHMLLASTSSVYGANSDMPFQETQKSDYQMSFYAATKKATENMAHAYAHLFGLPITMFRFFTVYGPWGRPDMALFKFTKNILAGQPIDIYNNGQMKRDFTYVDDLVKGIRLLIDAVPNPPEDGKVIKGDNLSPVAPFRVVNIGNSKQVQLMDYVNAVEDALRIKAQYNFMPMQAGDVPSTWANAELIHSLTGYKPETDVQTGVRRFVDWYRDFYSI
ncbi:MAG: GDP-mannose 4,6-dehydratase [Rhizobiaceae bacterium]|nr:GDP-mannose 4,6-dehydratase [Rhizobiaceae bacterium]